MTAHTIPHPQTISSEVAARKAARRKIIERAHRLERDSYKAMIQRKRQLQANSRLATMTWRMTTEEKLVQALENLQAGQERLEKTVGVVQADIKEIKHTQQEQGAAIKQQGSVINHIATAIKALATKQDIERVEKEVDKLKERLRPPRAD